MDYISEIYQRLNIPNIREFLLHGIEATYIDKRSYKVRIDSARQKMLNTLHNNYPDIIKNDKVMDCIYNYASVMEDVYMEIGLQSGAILTSQVFTNLTNYNEEAEEKYDWWKTVRCKLNNRSVFWNKK